MFVQVIATTGSNAHSNDYLGWLGIVEQITSGQYPWTHYFKDTLQAGVHCFAIPILVTAAIARFAAWSIDVTLYLALALAVVKLLLVHDGLTRGCEPRIRQSLLVVLSALFFSPAHINVYTFGFAATHVGLAELGFAIGLWGVSRFQARWLGLVVSCAGAWISTWSWGSGLIVWPILFLALPWLGFRRPAHFAFLAGCFAIAALPYLLYGSLGEHSGPYYAPPVGKGWLLLEAPGWLFSGSFHHGRARIAGLIAFGFLGASLVWLQRGSTERWRKATPAAMCLLYSFGLMVPVVLLRGQLNSWYTTSFGFIWVGLAGLVARVLDTDAPIHRDERVGCAAFGLVTLGLFITNGGYEDKVYYLKSRSPVATSCLRHSHNAAPICEQALFQWQGGHPEEVDTMAEVLGRNGWGAFGAHQEWALQGDYVFDFVTLERAPGPSEVVWTQGLEPLAASPLDYRRLNLFLPSPGAIHWPDEFWPVGNLPNHATATVPHSPPKRCAEMEPPGSSTIRYSSSHSTAKVTNPPATIPTIIEAAGGISAQPALLATSPPTQPLAQSEASVLPKRSRVIQAAVSMADAAARVAFTAISTHRFGSAPRYKMAPALSSPIHPSHTRKQPSSTITALCPGIAIGMRSGVNLPRRGLSNNVMASAVAPPTAWMGTAPPVSRKPWPRP